jgi:hypothetical protein
LINHIQIVYWMKETSTWELFTFIHNSHSLMTLFEICVEIVYLMMQIVLIELSFIILGNLLLSSTNLWTFNLFLYSLLMFWLIICMHLFQVLLDVFFFIKTFIFSCDKLSNSKQVLAIMGDLIISICEKGTIAHSQVYLNIYEAWQEQLN